MKIFCEIQLFDAHQIIKNAETREVVAVTELPKLGKALAAICNETDTVLLAGQLEIIENVIKQAKEINENIRIEVIKNV